MEPKRSAAESWQTFLGELDWWIAQHGDALVPQAATTRTVQGSPYPLGQRVKNHRIRYRRGTLDPAQIRELESRPGWSWDGYAGRSTKVWAAHLVALRAYVANHGAVDGLEAVDAPLARWLRDQRTAELTASQRRDLARIPGALEDRKGRLDEFLSLVRGWISLDPARDAGDIRFSTVHRVGRQRIPLGRRVAYWRARYAAGQLSSADASAIEQLPGWDWAPPAKRAAATAASAD